MPWIPRDVWERTLQDRDEWRDVALSLLRKEAGLPQPKSAPAVPPAVMPEEVVEVIRAWGSSYTQKLQEKRAWALYERYRNWDKVLSHMGQPEEVEA